MRNLAIVPIAACCMFIRQKLNIIKNITNHKVPADIKLGGNIPNGNWAEIQKQNAENRKIAEVIANHIDYEIIQIIAKEGTRYTDEIITNTAELAFSAYALGQKKDPKFIDKRMLLSIYDEYIIDNSCLYGNPTDIYYKQLSIANDITSSPFYCSIIYYIQLVISDHIINKFSETNEKVNKDTKYTLFSIFLMIEYLCRHNYTEKYTKHKSFAEVVDMKSDIIIAQVWVFIYNILYTKLYADKYREIAYGDFRKIRTLHITQKYQGKNTDMPLWSQHFKKHCGELYKDDEPSEILIKKRNDAIALCENICYTYATTVFNSIMYKITTKLETKSTIKNPWDDSNYIQGTFTEVSEYIWPWVFIKFIDILETKPITRTHIILWHIYKVYSKRAKYVYNERLKCGITHLEHLFASMIIDTTNKFKEIIEKPNLKDYQNIPEECKVEYLELLRNTEACKNNKTHWDGVLMLINDQYKCDNSKIFMQNADQLQRVNIYIEYLDCKYPNKSIIDDMLSQYINNNINKHAHGDFKWLSIISETDTYKSCSKYMRICMFLIFLYMSNDPILKDLKDYILNGTPMTNDWLRFQEYAQYKTDMYDINSTLYFEYIDDVHKSHHQYTANPMAVAAAVNITNLYDDIPSYIYNTASEDLQKHNSPLANYITSRLKSKESNVAETPEYRKTLFEDYFKMINTVKFTNYTENDPVGMAISKFIYDDDINALKNELPPVYTHITKCIDHMQQLTNHYIDYLFDTTAEKSELEKNIEKYISTGEHAEMPADFNTWINKFPFVRKNPYLAGVPLVNMYIQYCMKSNNDSYLIAIRSYLREGSMSQLATHAPDFNTWITNNKDLPAVDKYKTRRSATELEPHNKIQDTHKPVEELFTLMVNGDAASANSIVTMHLNAMTLVNKDGLLFIQYMHHKGSQCFNNLLYAYHIKYSQKDTVSPAVTPTSGPADAPDTPIHTAAADAPGTPTADAPGTPTADAPGTPTADAPGIHTADAPGIHTADAPGIHTASIKEDSVPGTSGVPGAPTASIKEDSATGPAADVTTGGNAPVTPEGNAPVTPEGNAPVTPEGNAPVTPEGNTPVKKEDSAPGSASTNSTTSTSANSAEVVKVASANSTGTAAASATSTVSTSNNVDLNDIKIDIPNDDHHIIDYTKDIDAIFSADTITDTIARQIIELNRRILECPTKFSISYLKYISQHKDKLDKIKKHTEDAFKKIVTPKLQTTK